MGERTDILPPRSRQRHTRKPVLGHGTIAVTERYGTIGDDYVEREALRLAKYRVPFLARRGAGGRAPGVEQRSRLPLDAQNSDLARGRALRTLSLLRRS